MVHRSRIIILLVAALFFACTEESAQYSNTYILIDITDNTLQIQDNIKNSIPGILGLMDISPTKTTTSGGEIKIFAINDLSETPSKTITLETGISGLLGDNPMDRLDQIKKFQKQLNDGINDILKKADWEKDNSKIYQNVCRELSAIVKYPKRSKKTMIIYSDMLENSSLLSFYSSNTDTMLGKIDEFLESKLSKDCSLPDLSEIELYIVTPRNEENDELINKAERFWKELFMLKKVKKITFDAELKI